MEFPNRYEIAHMCVEAAVYSAAGYVGAWFAAGPKSALSDPKAGVIMALGWRVTYALLGRRIFDWARQHFNGDESQALATAITVSGVGGVVAARLCGYRVGLQDITVLAIGLVVGIPVALIGLAVAIPLADRVINIFR